MSTYSFSFEAGALVRGRVLFELRSSAARYGLSFSALDDGGWLSTAYQCTVAGEEAAVLNYWRVSQEYLRRVS